MNAHNNSIGVSEDKEVRTFKITIEGNESRFEGTQAELWPHVSKLMANVPAGVVPKIEDVGKKQEAPPAPPAPPTTHAQAMARGVDTEGKQRSETDLAAAQAAGFSPARPLYDRGTPVIAVGVQNARESHRTWEAQPKLKDAVEKFCAHVASEKRRDHMVSIEHLGMYATGEISGVNDEKWTIEPAALVQLATRLKVKNPGYLVHVWPQLRAVNWNQMVATSVHHEKSTCPKDHPAYTELDSMQTVRVRLRDGADGKPSIWAVVSDSYAPFDVNEIARSLAVGLAPYDARCEVTYNGHGAQFDVLFHSNVQPEKYVAGEFFKVGYRVTTHDGGGGGVKVSLLAWQNLCLNLMCIDVASFTLANLRHLGSAEALANKFREAVKAGEQRLGHFLDAWNNASVETLIKRANDRYQVTPAVRLLDEMPTDDTFTEAEIVAGVFQGLKKSDKLSITNDDVIGLVAAHMLDTSAARQLVPVTRASVVNAVTRYAHETVGRLNPAKQSELESQAGALLVGSRGGNPAPLPFMPPRRASDNPEMPH